MDTRAAIIAIIVKRTESANEINTVLHEYSDYIIGRMGIPYQKKNINIISIAIDASQDIINTLAGKIGRIEGVTTKTVYSPED
ncbi:MAG: iron-only hydrogenase system regulator [Eubacterium sp.]|nr:iron-only hydrogenase system regulator [Eubacterium sp.]